MGKNRLVAILIVSFVSFGLIMAKVSAQAIPPAWKLDGGVYHMISSPYMPGNPEDRDPQVSLVDDLGLYDETQWRFFRYDPAQARYIELKTPDWGSEQDFDFGRGYWIISRDPTEIDIEGEPVVVGEARIILEHEGTGWNQIANIYDSDFLVEYLYVYRVSDPTPFPVKLIDPGLNDLTYVTLQEFENGLYIDIPGNGKNTLEVGKGYWLKVRDDVGEDVYLIFDPRGLQPVSTANFTNQDFLARVAQQEDPPDPPPGVESSSSVSFSGGSGSGGCFIATAAYRDYDHPKVQLLREFRDRYLLKSSFGRIVVGVYYRYSPILAKFVAKSRSIKAGVRFTLMPIIGISVIVSKINIYVFPIVLAFPFLGSFFLLRKRKEAWGKCKPKFSRKLRGKVVT
jgi:hypothetical protein